MKKDFNNWFFFDNELVEDFFDYLKDVVEKNKEEMKYEEPHGETYSHYLEQEFEDGKCVYSHEKVVEDGKVTKDVEQSTALPEKKEDNGKIASGEKDSNTAELGVEKDSNTAELDEAKGKVKDLEDLLKKKDKEIEELNGRLSLAKIENIKLSAKLNKIKQLF